MDEPTTTNFGISFLMVDLLKGSRLTVDLPKGSRLTVDLLKSELKSRAKQALLPVVGAAVAGVTLATLGLFSSFSVRLHQGLAALRRLLLVPLLVDFARTGSTA